MEGEVLPGKEFNRVYKDKVFVKLTNKKENHNGFQFKTGLNEDTVPFNPTGKCSAGGIYFCEYEKTINWLHYNSAGFMVYYRHVHVPDDSKVYIERGKYKADKIMLTDREKISEQVYIEALKKNTISLIDIETEGVYFSTAMTIK
jgi:hypothetical protein